MGAWLDVAFLALLIVGGTLCLVGGAVLLGRLAAGNTRMPWWAPAVVLFFVCGGYAAPVVIPMAVRDLRWAVHRALHPPPPFDAGREVLSAEDLNRQFGEVSAWIKQQIEPARR